MILTTHITIVALRESHRIESIVATSDPVSEFIKSNKNNKLKILKIKPTRRKKKTVQV
ncbi:hypothetical protein [Mesoplasma florum]|uniref:hypothetical protein n=1 Tax=Mesoplasma florum TaxID=2151 RepID=UPI0002D7147D|nr:hypothetical protein [Mesoplasma florum]